MYNSLLDNKPVIAQWTSQTPVVFSRSVFEGAGRRKIPRHDFQRHTSTLSSYAATMSFSIGSVHLNFQALLAIGYRLLPL